jgi:hypothetical protein
MCPYALSLMNTTLQTQMITGKSCSLYRAFRFLIVLVLQLSLASSLVAQTSRVNYISYDDARPIIEALEEILPPSLRARTRSELEAAWPGWVARRDAEIRARLAQGDEDSLANFLLFGTSYTNQPRITAQQLAQLGEEKETSASTSQIEPKAGIVLQARADDLLRSLSSPGSNERLVFARQVLADGKGYALSTAPGRAQAREFLLSSVLRLLSEHAAYAKALEQARLLGNASEEFAERSRLYRNRGLSSDTSLLPNFAIEESLKTMQARGLLAAGSVRRVAVVGPGLDFTDKQEGYDFYPQQSIQPFAIVDTLLRLGLSKNNNPQVTTFDLSPRVNHHLAGAVQRARRGLSYVLQLPRDPKAQWKPESIQYWERFGERIGNEATPVVVPARAGDLNIRAVKVRPAVVSRLNVMDLNIVLQRLESPPTERFDLIIATNILVYYDVFEQSLAMANIERMLRPGGFLLSNNALLELPSSKLHSVGYLTVVYSSRPNDGDHIVWYQRKVD